MLNSSSTAETILEAAESVTRALGYNGLSFRELAKAVGIKSASVHYHFPTKGHLGAAVARRYTDRIVARVAEIDVEDDGARAVAAYVAVFRSSLAQDGRMCLCGMLAAEVDAVPEEVRAEVRRFVDLNVEWLSGHLARGAGTRASRAAHRERALAILAALEGAMLIARGTGDVERFDAIARQFEEVGLLAG